MSGHGVAKARRFAVGVCGKGVGRRPDRARQQGPGQETAGQTDRPDEDPGEEQVAHAERQAAVAGRVR